MLLGGGFFVLILLDVLRWEHLTLEVSRCDSLEAVGLAASLMAWVTAEYLVPRTSERALNIWRTQVSRLPAHRLTRESDIWYRAQGNRFVHISLIDPSSSLIRGMSIFELAPDFDLLRRVDERTVQRDWAKARLWLASALQA